MNDYLVSSAEGILNAPDPKTLGPQETYPGKITRLQDGEYGPHAVLSGPIPDFREQPAGVALMAVFQTDNKLPEACFPGLFFRENISYDRIVFQQEGEVRRLDLLVEWGHVRKSVDSSLPRQLHRTETKYDVVLDFLSFELPG